MRSYRDGGSPWHSIANRPPVADLYPSANVLGIDLSPIQTEWVPANLVQSP